MQAHCKIVQSQQCHSSYPLYREEMSGRLVIQTAARSRYVTV